MEGGGWYGFAAPLSNAHPRLAGTLLFRPLHTDAAAGSRVLVPVDIHGRVQSSPVFVIIDDRTPSWRTTFTGMENEVMGAYTDFRCSASSTSRTPSWKTTFTGMETEVN